MNQDYFVFYNTFRNGRITAPELARLFEVSVRTIYRDIERHIEVFLYSVPGKAEGPFNERLF
ncbi:MAG: HTH domain-containing protein [Streptococcus sp.]